jgi:hypothetical protein
MVGETIMAVVAGVCHSRLKNVPNEFVALSRVKFVFLWYLIALKLFKENHTLMMIFLFFSWFVKGCSGISQSGKLKTKHCIIENGTMQVMPKYFNVLEMVLSTPTVQSNLGSELVAPDRFQLQRS